MSCAVGKPAHHKSFSSTMTNRNAPAVRKPAAVADRHPLACHAGRKKKIQEDKFDKREKAVTIESLEESTRAAEMGLLIACKQAPIDTRCLPTEKTPQLPSLTV